MDELTRLQAQLARAKSVHQSRAKTFRVQDYCFDKQVQFIQDPGKFKTLVCSRRAGKTVADAAYLLQEALATPGVASLYITDTRSQTKKFLWPELQNINSQFRLGGIPNETDLALKLPNKSVIYCSGAHEARQVERHRGVPYKLVIIDEAQLMRDRLLQTLVDDVLVFSLMDYNGTLVLSGTPGLMPRGYFWDAVGGEKSGAWSHHFWVQADNPHMVRKSGITFDQFLARELERRGQTVDDPAIRREFFGEWAVDTQSQILHYEPALNHYEQLPEKRGWNYIFGVDLGYEDADVIAVLAWHPEVRQVYLVEEFCQARQTIDELVIQLQRLVDKYQPTRMVIDGGGLGKKIAESIIQRHHIHLKTAEKTRKVEYLELLNSDLRTGRFRARKDSLFVADAATYQWDLEKQTPERRVIKGHSDVIDAVLYAWRESRHYNSEEPVAKPVYGSAEWAAAQVAWMELEAEKSLAAREEELFWGEMLF